MRACFRRLGWYSSAVAAADNPSFPLHHSQLGRRGARGSVKGTCVSILCQQKKGGNQLLSRSGGGSLRRPLNSEAAGVSHLTDFNEGTPASSTWLLRQRKILTEETFTIEWNYDKAWRFFIFTQFYSPVWMKYNPLAQLDDKHAFSHCRLQWCISPLRQRW